MKLNIKNIPNDIRLLHAINYKKIVSKSIDFDLKKSTNIDLIKNIAYKMIKTCVNDGGVGFAAPQLGIFKNIVIVKEFYNPNIWDSHTDYFNAYINPKITINRNSEKWTFSESCLSIPGKNFEISRHDEIKISYWHLDENNFFINKEETLTGYLARILLHEYDHLLGISIIDRFNQQNKK